MSFSILLMALSWNRTSFMTVTKSSSKVGREVIDVSLENGVASAIGLSGGLVSRAMNAALFRPYVNECCLDLANADDDMFKFKD